MYHPDQLRADLERGDLPVLEAAVRTGGCLVAGCPCKDARIVSFRRAAFHRAIARHAGETADRIVPVEPEWRITAVEGVKP